MKELLFTVFGQDFKALEWLFALFLSGLGFTTFKLLMFNKRSEKTSTFNPYFWWKDNKKEFYFGLICFYLLMRFHQDFLLLLNDNFNIPLITNRFLYLFTFGLFFTILLKKARSFFKIRLNKYANGNTRY